MVTDENSTEENPIISDTEVRIRNLTSKRDRTNRRLNIYYNELEYLIEAQKAFASGAQEYEINGKKISRFDMATVDKRIDTLLTKIEDLEAVLDGKGRSRMKAVVIRDI
jgi:hypothetical protein|nr:MAG TPA: hypothetical protein [Caudoviricetes sp.]